METNHCFLNAMVALSKEKFLGTNSRDKEKLLYQICQRTWRQAYLNSQPRLELSLLGLQMRDSRVGLRQSSAAPHGRNARAVVSLHAIQV